MQDYDANTAVGPTICRSPSANRSTLPRWVALIVTIVAIAPWHLPAAAQTAAIKADQIAVTWNDGDKVRTTSGRVVVSDQAGGVLLESRDGQQFIIEASKVTSSKGLETPFEPLSHQELGDRLLGELAPGFQIYTTPHYVVAYDTSLTYAKWTSSLLERLHRAFTGYWESRGFELHEPEFPLPVVVYATREDYQAACRRELGGAAVNVIGYYSLATNRVNMYDLTGSEALRAQQNERASFKTISRMLAQPAAVPLVATVVHEATHQIAFNCGMQTRFADIPLWTVEGMAVYFEAPDLTSSRGWTGIGKVNYERLEIFRGHLSSWNSKDFAELVSENTRFRTAATALDAYADAWALNYYLIRYRTDDYTSFLKVQQAKQPLVSTSSEAKRAEFEQHFGPIDELQQDFLKRMSRVR